MSKKYIGYTEEGYGILQETKLDGGGIARMVDYPKPVIPEMDAEERWWEEKVLPKITNEEYDELDFDVFDYQNFFPELTGKDVGAGAWIRVKTPTGWNVYWAKKSNKIFDDAKALAGIRRIERKNNQTEKDLEKLVILKKQVWTGSLLEDMDILPKYVAIRRTKTQKDYILPSQYELIEDINLYSDAVIRTKNKDAIQFVSLFTAEDKDAIFYLMSRGISRESAIMLSKMKHGYFKVDLKMAGIIG
jgi:hypothetical protein